MNNIVSKNPKVSIVIPVYNGSNYLREAIECALKQTYENIEVIVVNDGSCDEQKTENIALSYGDRVRYFYKENGGVSSALNYGIRRMTGEYFSWLSHDDGYSINKVKDSIELLREKNMLCKNCVAFTDGYFIDSAGAKIGNFKTYFDKNKIYTGLEVVKVMSKKGTLNGCCMMIHKNVFGEVGLFDEKLRYSQDSLMWYNIFLNGACLVSDGKANVVNRIHSKQVSQTRRDLYEHDALYIAKVLAEPLSMAGTDSEILYGYIVRLLRHQCHSAINYLIDFAVDKNLFTRKQMMKLHFAKAIGLLKYHVRRFCKKILFYVRKKRV